MLITWLSVFIPGFSRHPLISCHSRTWQQVSCPKLCNLNKAGMKTTGEDFNTFPHPPPFQALQLFFISTLCDSSELVLNMSSKFKLQISSPNLANNWKTIINYCVLLEFSIIEIELGIASVSFSNIMTWDSVLKFPFLQIQFGIITVFIIYYRASSFEYMFLKGRSLKFKWKNYLILRVIQLDC